MKEGKLGWSGLILLVRGSLAQSEDQRLNPTRGAPKIHFSTRRDRHIFGSYAESQRPMGRQDGV